MIGDLQYWNGTEWIGLDFEALSLVDVRHLVKRLERTVELINEGEHHMAAAKLLADISALKGSLDG